MTSDESQPSILTAILNFSTPAVQFLLLNLVIATILLTRRRRHNPEQPPTADEVFRNLNSIPNLPPPLARGPSSVIHRLRSLVSGELQPQFIASNSEHENEKKYERSRSESGEERGRLAARMKKSASENSAFKHFEAAEIVRRPAAVAEEEEREVDARADDFINRFRQQLKLQRLDSLLRYKEMIHGHRS